MDETPGGSMEAQQQAFLDAIMELRGRPGKGVSSVVIHEAFQTIDAMLEAGLDPNFSCGRCDLIAAARVEASPLFIALLLEPGSCQQRLLAALFRHGANLLIDETLLEMAAKKMRAHPALSNFLAKQLAAQEQDRPARTPEGGTLVHAMAAHDARIIPQWLQPGHPIVDTARQWLGQTDAKARLPLDVAIAAAKLHLATGGFMEDDCIEATYKIAAGMLQSELGDALRGRRDIGDALASMSAGSPSRCAVMAQLESLWCQQDLETRTLMAPGTARAPRL